MIGNTMIATTMYWPVDQYKQIAKIADWENKPKAQVVRELTAMGMENKIPQKGNAKQVFDALQKLQVLVPRDGTTDLAKNHDHYAWD
ncbi:MAG: hypothetical protein AAB838_02840 [Patescibacteria group bacterium]